MEIKGINHLALVTGDMDRTVRFYRDALGFPLVATIGNRPDSYPYRHYFFEIGPDTTLAFFEWPGMVEEFHKPAGLPEKGRWQFDHLSFNVETEEELLELQRKLEAHGTETTVVIDHQFIHSIYFTDPNGIALEASVWITNPTGRPPMYDNRYIFQDPDPVLSLKEELEQAHLLEKI